IRVHDRTHAALTGQELLHLAGHVTTPIPADVKTIAEQVEIGDTVFVEVDDYDLYRKAGFAGSVSATVVETEPTDTNYGNPVVTVELDDGQRMSFWKHRN